MERIERGIENSPGWIAHRQPLLTANVIAVT
jgi:hypothetical protein